MYIKSNSANLDSIHIDLISTISNVTNNICYKYQMLRISNVTNTKCYKCPLKCLLDLRSIWVLNEVEQQILMPTPVYFYPIKGRLNHTCTYIRFSTLRCTLSNPISLCKRYTSFCEWIILRTDGRL